MAGPALATVLAVRQARRAEIGRHRQRAVASSQLPFNRSNASGQPCSQRALNRSVAVWPAASVLAFKRHLAGIVTRPDPVAAADVQ